MFDAKKEQRRLETGYLVSNLGKRKFNRCLELGCGEGYQTKFLLKKCKKIISGDINIDRIKVKLPNVKRIKLDAEKVDFPEKSFDLVFSSYMLEHIVNKRKCLAGCARLLKKDGMMVHIVPTRMAKLRQLLLYYPNAVKFILSRKKRVVPKMGNNPKSQRKRSLLDCIFPPIHGEYKSHIEEFKEYGKKQ
ncbi:MAG: class I SAM-dependent methyltransferase, partial [bacterium]